MSNPSKEKVSEAPLLPTELPHFGPTPMSILFMQDIEEFNSDYYKSQEYLEGGRGSSCEGGLEDGNHYEAVEEGRGLNDFVWPLEMLSVVENYGELGQRRK